MTAQQDTPLPSGSNDAIDMNSDPYDRYYKDAIGTAPELPAIRHIIAIIVLFCIGSLYYLIPASFIVTLIGTFYYRNTWCIVGLVTLVTLSIIPLPQNSKLRNHWLLRTMCEYFNMRWIEHTPLSDFSTDTRYIAVWMPHGVIPFAGLAAGALYDRVSPNFYGRVCMQPVLFSMPLLRQLFALYNGVPNDRHTIVDTLKGGQSISIWTGGIAELFLSSPDREMLYLKSRKGFCKLALQTGAHICVYYAFGNNHMFSTSNKEHGILSTLSRKLGASIIFFWGRWGLPIPRQTNVLIVRGSNIPVKQVDNPTQEQIDELHTTVVNEVQTLFDRYKEIAGHQHANKTLEIR